MALNCNPLTTKCYHEENYFLAPFTTLAVHSLHGRRKPFKPFRSEISILTDSPTPRRPLALGGKNLAVNQPSPRPDSLTRNSDSKISSQDYIRTPFFSCLKFRRASFCRRTGSGARDFEGVEKN